MCDLGAELNNNQHDGPVGVELPAVVRLDRVNGSAESAGDDETEDKNDDLGSIL